MENDRTHWTWEKCAHQCFLYGTECEFWTLQPPRAHELEPGWDCLMMANRGEYMEYDGGEKHVMGSRPLSDVCSVNQSKDYMHRNFPFESFERILQMKSKKMVMKQ